jgi:hypothetical protein
VLLVRRGVTPAEMTPESAIMASATDEFSERETGHREIFVARPPRGWGMSFAAQLAKSCCVSTATYSWMKLKA